MVAVARAAPKELIEGFKGTRKSTNGTWNVARRAPMFIKKPNPDATRKVVRSQRLIGSHAYKIVASGAAAYARARLKEDSAAYRMQVKPETRRAPWLPSFSVAATAMLECFLSAYAAEGLKNAAVIRRGLGTHRRITPKTMALAFEVLDEHVWNEGGGTPYLAPPPPRRKKVAVKAEAEGGEEAGKKKGGKKGNKDNGEAEASDASDDEAAAPAAPAAGDESE